MNNAVNFNSLLENVEKMPLEDQEIFIEIIRKRIVTHRRRALAKDIASAEKEYLSGKLKPETPEEIMHAILS